MLDILEAGCKHVEDIQEYFFHFLDFNFYNTVIDKRIQVSSNAQLGAGMWLLLFYVCSAVLFCAIMQDDAVCPNRDTYEGWVTAVYFASSTMVSC